MARYQMPDGSYPIDNCADVTKAANLAHHSKTYTFAQVKAHVMTAMEGLSCPTSVLPDTWTEGSEAPDKETGPGESSAAKGVETRERPPRDGLVRAISGCEIRDDGDADTIGTMHGHLAVFNQWSEINSIHEGHFLERLHPDAFNGTIANHGSRMKVTFNHGKDPQLGDKVLGIPTVLEPDEIGVRYEVPLLNTSYNRDLAPGLRAGAYGSSFRFNVTAEDFKKKPGASDYNPRALPERTVREVQMQEFGPVTFPAYEGASAGMRSLTDRFTPPASARPHMATYEEFLQLING
jgi:HK97 family phage prohead protease